jgi:hypothetical protein
MRAIALAIVLGLGGIEMAFRKNDDPKHPYADRAMGLLGVAFLICLIGGW